MLKGNKFHKHFRDYDWQILIFPRFGMANLEYLVIESGANHNSSVHRFYPCPKYFNNKKRTIFDIPDIHTDSDSIDEIVAIVKAIVVTIQMKVDISQVSLNLT